MTSIFEDLESACLRKFVEDFAGTLRKTLTLSRHEDPYDAMSECSRSELIFLMTLTGLANNDIQMCSILVKAVNKWHLFPRITSYIGDKLKTEFDISREFLVTAKTFAKLLTDEDLVEVPLPLIHYIDVLITEIALPVAPLGLSDDDDDDDEADEDEDDDEADEDEDDDEIRGEDIIAERLQHLINLEEMEIRGEDIIAGRLQHLRNQEEMEMRGAVMAERLRQFDEGDLEIRGEDIIAGRLQHLRNQEEMEMRGAVMAERLRQFDEGDLEVEDIFELGEEIWYGVPHRAEDQVEGEEDCHNISND